MRWAAGDGGESSPWRHTCGIPNFAARASGKPALGQGFPGHARSPDPKQADAC